MAVTLREVAAKLSLSPGLVSGVLNNRANVWASEETRERIRVTALELGYRPNAAARALSARRAHAIGFVYLEDEPTSAMYSAMLVVYINYLSSMGWELLVRACSSQEQVLANLQEMALTCAVDGFILWGVEPAVEVQARLLDKLEMPFIAKGRFEDAHPDWPQVDYDHEAMMDRAVKSLADRGHRRVAYLAPDTDLPFRYCLMRGFIAASEAYLGGPAAPGMVLEGISSISPTAALARWLSMPENEQPTALILGFGDAPWREIEIELARHGRRMGFGPGEFAVTGITHERMDLLFGYAEAFVSVDFAELARELVDKLLPALLARQPIEHPVVRVCPRLAPLPSLDLLSLGLFPGSASGASLAPQVTKTD